MIERVGVDLVEIGRIAKAMSNPRFVEKILTPREREEPLTVSYVAGRWAAKEAIAKCLPIQEWQKVEVVKDEFGAPFVIVHDDFLMKNLRLHVSISHERSHAVAVAILESSLGS